MFNHSLLQCKFYNYRTNNIIIFLFLIEMVIKIIALSPHDYFKSKLNFFDALITIIGLIEYCLIY